MERTNILSGEFTLFNEPNFGFDFLVTFSEEINQINAKNEIEEYYKNSLNTSYGINDNGSFVPEILFLSSPMSCQLASFILVSMKDEESEEQEERIKNLLRNYVSYTIWEKTSIAVKKAINNHKINNEHSFINGKRGGLRNAVDNLLCNPRTTYYWPWYNKIYCNELVQHGIFEMITLHQFCIVSELPIKILKNSQKKLHSEDGPAVEWRDGFGLYFWNGIRVPKEWIFNRETITKETIISENNIERRRCLMEIIGSEKYYELMDIVCVDKSIDENKNPMKLFRTKEKDKSIDEFLFFLNVVDPSTKREYFLSVPPSYDVNWAKASTFQDKKIQYRQGDVGLLNLNVAFDKPIIET